MAIEKDLRFEIGKAEIQRVLQLRNKNADRVNNSEVSVLIEKMLSEFDGKKMAEIVIALTVVVSALEKLGPNESPIPISDMVKIGVPLFNKLILPKEMVH